MIIYESFNMSKIKVNLIVSLYIIQSKVNSKILFTIFDYLKIFYLYLT